MRHDETRRRRFNWLGATAILACIACLFCCMMPNIATAQTPDQPAMNTAPSDTGTALAAELNRHNAEVARILEREQFRFTNLATGPASPASPASPALSATTCNCAVTGICTCNPANCVCAACRNGQLRASQYAGVSVQYRQPMASYSQSYSGSAPLARTTVMTAPNGIPIAHVTSTGRFDRKGREWLELSGMSKRQARATAAANH